MERQRCNIFHIDECIYYHIANKNFVFHNTNLIFKSIIIYNFIKYILGFNVDKGILAEQPIRT
jgi:hypothetical protein